MGRRQLSGNYADSSPDCRLKLCEKVCESPLLFSAYVCVCTSGAQGLLSIGSVWLNVKNCGFLPGASLSGSLPCLHFLNTPLFLNLLQVFGQDAKNTHRTWGAGLSPPPHHTHTHPLQPLSSRPGFFFSFSSDAEIKRLLLIMGQSYVMCFLFGHLLFNLRLFLICGSFLEMEGALYSRQWEEKRDYCHKDYSPPPSPLSLSLLKSSLFLRRWERE